MAKVVKPSPVPTSSLQIGGGGVKVGAMAKRKTPSELRGEQLKRMNPIEIIDESPAPFLGLTSEVSNGLKKPELPRNPRYIETRMDELYPAKKSRFRIPSGKENTKDVSMGQPGSLKNLSLLSSLAAKKRNEPSPQEKSVGSEEVAKADAEQVSQTIGRSSQSIFRSVRDLSLDDNKSSGIAAVDMNKALQGLVARESSDVNGLPASSSERSVDHTLANIGNFCLSGQKIPLDFTLKTSMRVVSSSPVSWVHRLLTSCTYTGLPSLGLDCSVDRNRSNSSRLTSTSEVSSPKMFHSWIYPQSILPSSIISVLTSSAAEGVEVDFLKRRQLAWEDSFRSLYYMLRNGICNIFYVCTPHFVVMFTASDGVGGTKPLCNAYISQSTRSFRALLREQDVSFSMPLCLSKIEQVTTEDLVELSEIEKQNLGQTRRRSSSCDIDHSPESLLVFNGNKSVHGLYDIILNYRSFLTSLTGMDVPVLYSPIPFQNAASSAPEIKCMELKRAENISTADKGSAVKDVESTDGLPSGFCSSVEVKDSYIPPWIISSICALMGSEGKSFEASFMTDPTSVTLNAAIQEATNEKSDKSAAAGEDSKESHFSFGIPGAVVTPHLHSGLLKGLKYSNGSYTATCSPV